MKSQLIASRLSVSARVDAIIAGGANLQTHSADPTAAAMDRAAGLSAEDVARYGAERDVRRALGRPSRITTHAVTLIEDLVSGPCAECLDAVSGLGVAPHHLPILADLYEVLFEMKDAVGAPEIFPTASVWGPAGPDSARASMALDRVLGVMARPLGSDRFAHDPAEPHGAGIAGYARTELDHLLDRSFASRYFTPDPIVSRLGSPLEIEVGDLVRIALFVAFARQAGVQPSGLDEVRELTVKALRG